jgi:hypothetical protein
MTTNSTSTEREFTMAAWRKTKSRVVSEAAKLDKLSESDRGAFLDLVVTYNVWGDQKPIGDMADEDLTSLETVQHAAVTGSQDSLLIALLRAYGAERIGDLPAQVLEAAHG